jgi:DNA polymerase III subunit beta
MKLIILRGNLKEGLAALERAVVDNNNLPILKSVLFKADTRVTLQATNLEIGVTYQTNAKITEQGSLAVPFAPLHSIIQNSTSERISLEAAGHTLTVKTDNYEAKIQGIAAEEFPIIPKLENEGAGLEMSCEVFKSGMMQIYPAAATTDLKPELNSILIDFQSGQLKAAATDGFRLAEKTFPHNTFGAATTDPIKALVPLKTIQEAIRIFPDREQLTISFDQNQVLFKSKDIVLISRLIDGNYPDYGAIVPKQTPVEIVADREQLGSAIKLVSNFSGKTSDVKLRLNADNLEVFASNQLVGENAYQVPIKKKKGDSVAEIVFNWRYVLDGIRALPGSSLSLGVTSEAKPVILRPADDDSVFYIVMPIQA